LEGKKNGTGDQTIGLPEGGKARRAGYTAMGLQHPKRKDTDFASGGLGGLNLKRTPLAKGKIPNREFFG